MKCEVQQKTGTEPKETKGLKEKLRLLHAAEQQVSRESEKQVMIEHAVNLRLMCDYVVSCSYGDVVLIICMLHDYIKTLDEVRGDDIQYQAYYRKKFAEMAARLAEQIEYDYDAALEKCRKKQEKDNRDQDIGDDGLTHLIKRGIRAAEKRGEGRGQNEDGKPEKSERDTTKDEKPGGEK